MNLIFLSDKTLQLLNSDSHKIIEIIQNHPSWKIMIVELQLIFGYINISYFHMYRNYSFQYLVVKYKPDSSP